MSMEDEGLSKAKEEIRDGAQARAARAKRLHVQIDRLVAHAIEDNPQGDNAASDAEKWDETSVANVSRAENPRDFIHRRMQEVGIDLKKAEEQDTPPTNEPE